MTQSAPLFGGKGFLYLGDLQKFWFVKVCSRFWIWSAFFKRLKLLPLFEAVFWKNHAVSDATSRGERRWGRITVLVLSVHYCRRKGEGGRERVKPASTICNNVSKYTQCDQLSLSDTFNNYHEQTWLKEGAVLTIWNIQLAGINNELGCMILLAENVFSTGKKVKTVEMNELHWPTELLESISVTF